MLSAHAQKASFFPPLAGPKVQRNAFPCCACARPTAPFPPLPREITSSALSRGCERPPAGRRNVHAHRRRSRRRPPGSCFLVWFLGSRKRTGLRAGAAAGGGLTEPGTGHVGLRHEPFRGPGGRESLPGEGVAVKRSSFPLHYAGGRGGC